MSQAAVTDPAATPVEAFAAMEQNGATLMPLRKAGLARFAESGYPSIRDEDWRFTNLRPLTELPFRPVAAPLGQAPGPEQLDGLTFGRLDADRLVLLTNAPAPALDALTDFEIIHLH